MVKKMKKTCLMVIGILFLVLSVSATQSESAVSVNIGVNIPAYRFAAPPQVVVIPGTYVYMVPDIDVDILFFQGYWWRPYEGHWYRSSNYKGSWRYVAPARVPRGLRELPQDYRSRLSPEYDRVPHRDVKRNWKKWEREKYWEKRGDKQGRHGHPEQDRGRYGDQQDRERQDRQRDRY